LKDIKILLVQEIGTMTGELMNTMRNIGLIVLGVAETGEDAVRMAEEKKPDVVLIDTRLRVGMTSGQTADALSSLSSSPGIIYMTFNKNDVPQHPSYPYVLKPFSLDEVSKKIKEVLKIQDS
jgi:DNA-binding response OmpR family regulator